MANYIKFIKKFGKIIPIKSSKTKSLVTSKKNVPINIKRADIIKKIELRAERYSKKISKINKDIHDALPPIEKTRITKNIKGLSNPGTQEINKKFAAINDTDKYWLSQIIKRKRAQFKTAREMIKKYGNYNNWQI